MYSKSFAIFSIFLLHSTCDSARILGVFPMPFLSHQSVFKQYTQELAGSGHELVVVTPIPPVFQKENSLKNTSVIVIDTLFPFDQLYQIINIKFQRGFFCTTDCMLDFFKINNKNLQKVMTEQMVNPEIDKLVRQHTKIDLVIAEGFVGSTLIFGKLFDAPVIQFSTFYLRPENFETIGAPAWHPITQPYLFRRKYGNLSLLDTILEVEVQNNYYGSNKNLVEYQTAQIKTLYGSNAPSIEELKENVYMAFGTCHRIFDYNRAVPVNVIYLGALHLKPVNEIPEDLKTYLDQSLRGVIYVSFGSNVLLSAMDADLLNVFLDAFKILPYDILLKSDIDDLNVSNNVKISRWFPQRDLLMHGNIKAFIMQGGLQSTDEAIDAEVPLIGMPSWGDQRYNIQRYRGLGIGTGLDPLTVTVEDVVDAVTTVTQDLSYKKNIRRLKSWIQDQPQSALERAVWWTEYVVRHGGARHLRSPAANMSWSEYYEGELFCSLGLMIAFISLLILYIIRCAKKRKVS